MTVTRQATRGAYVLSGCVGNYWNRSPIMATANGKAATTAATLTCPECGKTFTRAAALGAHRKMTHGVAGTSKNATSKTTTRKRTTTSGSRRASAASSNGATRTVDRDALLRMLF